VTIDLYGPANSESATQLDKTSVEKAASVGTQLNAQPATTEDKTTFSSGTDSVQSLSNTALQTVPSRQDKVEALRQAVNSAQYQLDADKIAESLANADI
jgi:flagellar biosynthesis anti-sigma factor FlgM